jgi:hypothetical protein
LTNYRLRHREFIERVIVARTRQDICDLGNRNTDWAFSFDTPISGDAERFQVKTVVSAVAQPLSKR